MAYSDITPIFELRPLDFRFIFAYAVSMLQGPTTRKQFVVTCKRCRRDVPSGIKELPFPSVMVECCLCGEKRPTCLLKCSSASPIISLRSKERRG